tara:strand:- start:20601 stop:21938 length:1338 start_codon:yes stop_codon:yes gene_type:complete
MCSFFFSNKNLKSIKNLLSEDYYNKLRGPNITNILEHKEIILLHNLLSMSEDFSPQPKLKNNCILLFNGEIYNNDIKKYKSDTDYLIDLLINEGALGLKKIRGEFALIFINIEKSTILVARDTFGTKPLSYVHDGEKLLFSTLPPLLFKFGYSKEVKEFPVNKFIEYDLDNASILREETLHQFNLNQEIDSFDEFENILRESIELRCREPRENSIFSGLSSGYDSGTIHLMITQLNKSCKFYTVGNKENNKIINERVKLSPKVEHKKINIGLFSKMKINSLSKKKLFKFNSLIKSDQGDYNEFDLDMRNDNGTRKFLILCNCAKKDKKNIFLSGVGPDEIFSDYGHKGKRYYPHSNFGGLFPSDLNKIFPWGSFFDSSMRTYINKEEYVGGSFGMEIRYPFLDIKLIQSFLSLKAELKNSNYKAPLHHILEKYSYPFEKNIKRGF